MHIICGYVTNKTAGGKDVHSWYAAGIGEIRNLLKDMPQAFQEDYAFVDEVLKVSDKITTTTANEFEKSTLG